MSSRAVGVVLLLVTATARAADDAPPPPLVTCGAERVAIFMDTQSKDGRYALGWTLRDPHAPPPAPWSLYDPDGPAASVMRRLVDDAGADRPGETLTPVAGIVDVRGHRFSPLTFRERAFPGRARDDDEVAWLEGASDPRIGVVVHNHDGKRATTSDLLLATLDGGAVRITDLRPLFERAIRDFLARRDAKHASSYTWACATDRLVKTGRQPYAVFHADTMTLPCIAELDEHHADAGFVAYSLARGVVTAVTPDPVARRELLH